MTTPATAQRQPMTSFQKTVVGLLVALVLAVVAATITFAAVTHGQSVEQKKAECDKYTVGSFDYFYCLDQADK